MTTDAKNFRFIFTLNSLKVDSRDFRQDSDMFFPSVNTSVHVEILLPRENEYIANLSEISIAELSSDENPPAPVLTPKGYAYIKKALEMGFDSPNLKETLSESDDWGNTVDTEKILEPGKSAPAENLAEWGDSPFAEKVESEAWEDEKEQW